MRSPSHCSARRRAPAQTLAGTSRPAGSANAAVGADKAPDRSARGRSVASPATSQALTVIQRRIADYVAKHGTSHTFASYLDSDTDGCVDTDAPASVVSGLTSMSDPDRRREVG